MKAGIKIIARDKSDKETAKVLNKIFDYQMDKYQDVIDSLSKIPVYLSNMYGEHVKLPEKLLNDVLKSVIEMEVKVLAQEQKEEGKQE